MENKVKIIPVFTGPPGVGKSKVYEKFAKKLQEERILFHKEDEYGHIVSWANEHMGNGLVSPDQTGDSFVFSPQAYKEWCPAVAKRIGESILKNSNGGVVLLETARGVGDPQVGYVEGFFEPLRDVLLQGGVEPNFINLEVDGGNRRVLEARMANRFIQNPKGSAPPEILNNYYFSDRGMPISSGNELKGNKKLVELSFLIDNTGDFDQLDSEVEGVINRLGYEQWWRELPRRVEVEGGFGKIER